MKPRVLILMRHGKAVVADGVADHDRPLAERGQREAALAGDWLRNTQPPVDLALCSTSVRTRQTLAATGLTVVTTYEDQVYGGSPRQLIDLIRIVDDVVTTLMLVGHAPGIPWTAWELAANRSSMPAEQMSAKFPTSAMAILEFDRPWLDVDAGTGDLVAFHVPR